VSYTECVYLIQPFLLCFFFYGVFGYTAQSVGNTSVAFHVMGKLVILTAKDMFLVVTLYWNPCICRITVVI